MLKLLTRPLIYTTVFLTVAYLLQWYFIDYYFTQLPEYIPHTNLKTDGALILLTVIVTFYFFQKKAIEKIPTITLSQLTGLSAIICFFAEIIFQAIRHLVEPDTVIGKLFGFLHSTIISTLISIAIVFLEALQLKHPRSIWNRLIPALFVIVIIIFKKQLLFTFK